MLLFPCLCFVLLSLITATFSCLMFILVVLRGCIRLL